jgi:hypothetical protein
MKIVRSDALIYVASSHDASMRALSFRPPRFGPQVGPWHPFHGSGSACCHPLSKGPKSGPQPDIDNYVSQFNAYYIPELITTERAAVSVGYLSFSILSDVRRQTRSGW